MTLKLPHSLVGWKRLTAITLRRCPLCWGPLCRNWPQYDNGETIYCLPCGGLILPRGFWRALAWNARAERP